MTDGSPQNTGAPGGVVLRASGVVRRFREGSTTLEVLTGLDLDVRAGERLGIIGASGSGKTTLLQILGGLVSYNSAARYKHRSRLLCPGSLSLHVG